MDKTGVKILVVDDDRHLLALLTDTLSSVGYSVTAAQSASDALDHLAGASYDMVISDIKMPEIDGFGLLSRVRELRPGLPVIFITGVFKPDIVGEANPEGFLAKPFRISNLEGLIEQTLKGKQQQSDSSVQRILVVDDDEELL